jgi:hypothetical protein
VRRPETEIVPVLEGLAAGDRRILRATPGTHGETLYEVFSDLLVMPVRDWQARLGTERRLWRHAEEVRRERDRGVRLLERRVRLLLVVVAALTVLVVLLAVALLVAKG